MICCNFSPSLSVVDIEGENFKPLITHRTVLNYTYIEQLLECYFNCETSLAEERILRAFFAQDADKVPAHLLRYRQLFAEQAFAKNSDTLGEEFDRRIMEAVGEVRKQEPMHVKARSISMSRRLRPLYKAAACVAVVLALGQAAQMPYSDAETEQREDFARSVEMLQRIQQDKNTVAQSDTVINGNIEDLKN